MIESVLNNEHAKRGAINISTPPYESNKDFSKESHFVKKYLDNITSKIRGIFWVTVILRSTNMSYLSLQISAKFDQFVQFVTPFELNMHENSIVDDCCFIYSTLYLKKYTKTGCQRLLLNMLKSTN